MKTKNKQAESGQAMIIMVFGLIALLGMVALAIDGGRALTERRKVQNAADASAMAAVRELGSGASSVTARQVARETAAANGYQLDEADIIISDEKVIYGTYNTGRTGAYSVLVDIKSGVESTFAQLIFDEFIAIGAQSKMEVRLRATPFEGFGIVSLASSCANNANGVGVGNSGGGNSGGVEVFGSSILSNVPDPNDNCAFNPSNSAGATGIRTWECDTDPPPDEFPPYDSVYNCTETIIYTIGTFTCATASECANIGTTESLGGEPFPDPLADLPNPQCSGPGTKTIVSGSGANAVYEYTPGTFSHTDLGAGTYLPGIYCIYKGNGSGFVVNGGLVDASSGVLFYFYDNGAGGPLLSFRGGGELDLRAPGNGTSSIPSKDDCLYTQTEPCTYRGMAIFVQQGVEMDVNIQGNAVLNIWGTVYGNNATLSAGGGGSEGYEINVFGQVIMNQVLNDGSGSLKVYYDDDLSFSVPPYINTVE